MKVFIVVQITYPFANQKIRGVFGDTQTANDWIQRWAHLEDISCGEFEIKSFEVIDNHNKTLRV